MSDSLPFAMSEPSYEGTWVRCVLDQAFGFDLSKMCSACVRANSSFPGRSCLCSAGWQSWAKQRQGQARLDAFSAAYSVDSVWFRLAHVRACADITSGHYIWAKSY